MSERRRIAALLALCALTAGTQGLAPASAGASANQATTCEPTAVPGIGIDNKTRVICILEGSGIEVVEIEGSPVLCPTPSRCLARGPLHAGPGGGGGEGDPADGPWGKPSGRSVLGFSPSDVEEARRREQKKTRLRDAMNTQERKLKKALCLLIDTWMNRVWAHAPKDPVDLVGYRNDKELAKQGMNPGFVEDGSKERELPALEVFERQLDHIENSSRAADCGFFPPRYVG